MWRLASTQSKYNEPDRSQILSYIIVKNFIVWSEVVESGAVTKSQKGKRAYVERKVGEIYHWKPNGQCSNGDSFRFSHELASGNSGGAQRRKRQSSSPAPNSKAKTDGEGGNTSKESGNRDECSSDQRSKIPCRHRICNNPSCGCWRPVVCPNYKSKNGCTFGNKCFFRHVEAEQKPSKESKKGGAKGSLASLKESTQLGCVSRDSYPRKFFQREKENLGSNHAVKISRSTWHQIQIRERKGRGMIQKCVPHERSLCAPKVEERSDEETSNQEGCARRAAWDVAKIFSSSSMRTKLRFILLLKQG